MIHPVDANQPLVGSPSATITGSFVLTQHELPLIKVCVATSAEGSLPPEVINTEPSIWHHTWGDHSGTWWQVDYFVFLSFWKRQWLSFTGTTIYSRHGFSLLILYASTIWGFTEFLICWHCILHNCLRLMHTIYGKGVSKMDSQS